jgi:hypothetical protein
LKLIPSPLSPALSPVPVEREKNRAALDLIVAALIAVGGWIIYHRALGLWFTYDDFFHLHFLNGAGRWEYFYRPEVWQRLPFKMITQLLFLSLDFDQVVFGLDAHGFLIHQLVSFSLCVAVLYLVLRLWLPRLWAFLGTALFAIGPVTVTVAPLLMVRHYVETLLLGLLAVGAYVLALRRGRRLAVASAVFYFLAMLAKEIAVPLVFLLVLIPEGTFRRRLAVAAPHLGAFVLYLCYRLYMLGTFAGGYGWLVEPSDLPRLALGLPAKIGMEMLGRPSTASWAMLLCLLIGLGMVALRQPLLLVASALLALLPILPVSTEMEPRYALPAWLLLSLTFPFAVRPLVERKRVIRLVGIGLVLIATAGALFAHLDAREETFARLERMSAEHLAFLEITPGEYLRDPLGPPATMGELAWFKADLLKKGPAAGWFYDDYFLCAHPDLGRVWSWESVQQEVVDVTASMPSLRRRHCHAFRKESPLTVEMHAAGRTLHWTLGPYQDGRYSFVLGDGIQSVEVPPVGGFQLQRVGALSLRLKYESLQGWTTYSPELAMDFTRAPSFRWSRPAPPP